MSNLIIFSTILLLFVLIIILSISAAERNNKIIKEKVFKQLHIISSDFLDILDVVSYDNANYIEDFSNLDDFCNFVVLDAKNRICDLVKDMNLNIDKNMISFTTRNKLICEFVDKLISDNKYMDIFESIYLKALDDMVHEQNNNTEVTKIEKSNEKTTTTETDISKNIENFYI